MKKYELALALSVKIEDDERAALLDKAKGYIERFGGQITNVDDWGKRRLAYEVDHMKEAFYYFIQFDAEPTAPAEIENRIRIMENVVRFLIVRADEA
jgi:small subunit ribosomal protein S6